MNKEISIHLGAMSDPLTRQLKGKTNLTVEDLKFFDRLADSITLLHIHGYIPDSATDKARTRLIRELAKKSKSK